MELSTQTLSQPAPDLELERGTAKGCLIFLVGFWGLVGLLVLAGIFMPDRPKLWHHVGTNILQIRASPSEQAAKGGTLHPGQAIKTLEVGPVWLKVQHNGKTGYLPRQSVVSQEIYQEVGSALRQLQERTQKRTEEQFRKAQELEEAKREAARKAAEPPPESLLYQFLQYLKKN